MQFLLKSTALSYRQNTDKCKPRGSADDVNIPVVRRLSHPSQGISLFALNPEARLSGVSLQINTLLFQNVT
jgi:hypothetical protein